MRTELRYIYRDGEKVLQWREHAKVLPDVNRSRVGIDWWTDWQDVRIETGDLCHTGYHADKKEPVLPGCIHGKNPPHITRFRYSDLYHDGATEKVMAILDIETGGHKESFGRIRNHKIEIRTDDDALYLKNAANMLRTMADKMDALDAELASDY